MFNLRSLLSQRHDQNAKLASTSQHSYLWHRQSIGWASIGVLSTLLLVACGSTPNQASEPADEFEAYIEPAPAETTTALPVAPPPQATNETVILAIRDDAPDSYTVKRGDTLWDISSIFLRDAWLWPEIWYFNPQIDNPHLIFPGDVLNFVYVDGQPRVQLAQATNGNSRILTPNGSGLNATRLSPRVRATDLDQAIPTISLEDIGPFLTKPKVVTEAELDAAPYVVSSLDQHLATAAGDTIFVMNMTEAPLASRHEIYRPGAPLRSPGSRKILGYETTLVSEARLLKTGEDEGPATLQIIRSEQETLNRDRILPADTGAINPNFMPKAPSQAVDGNIIALVNAITQTGKNEVVIIDVGSNDGLEVGDVLAINQRGDNVRDPLTRKIVALPDVRAGVLMIFRTFDEVSYGLIMASTRPIHELDKVTNPAPILDVISE